MIVLIKKTLGTKLLQATNIKIKKKISHLNLYINTSIFFKQIKHMI